MPKMKAYANFDLYLAGQTPKNQTLIRALRAFVKRTCPELVESVKWGNGCWLNGKVPAAYVYADADHVQFGFIRGAELADPKGLLQGSGAYVRHVKVRTPADVDPKAFGALLTEAAKYDTLPKPGRKKAAVRKPAAKKATTRMNAAKKPAARKKPTTRRR